MACNEHRLFGWDDCAACRDNDRLAVLEEQRAALEEANRLAAQRDHERRRAERRAEDFARKQAFEAERFSFDPELERRRREEANERQTLYEERKLAWAERAYGDVQPATRRQRRISGAVASVVVLLALLPLVAAPANWTGIALVGTAFALGAILIRRWMGGSYLIFRFGAFDATGWMLIGGAILLPIGSRQGTGPTEVGAGGVIWRSLLLLGLVAGTYVIASRLAKRSRWQEKG